MKDQLLITIGNRIEELRLEHRISREKLEEECGLNNQSIKKIERIEREKNPLRSFDVKALCAIANYFDVDIEYLLGMQNTKRRQVAEVSKVTGLSYEAVDILSSFGKINQTELDTLSALICSPSFIAFVVLLTRYCLLEGESKNMLKEGYSNLSDKEIMIAAIQNNVSMLINEVKSTAHNELMLTKNRTRAFALVAAAAEKTDKVVREADILEALTACGLDAEKEILAFYEYFAEYKNIMKKRE